MSKVKFIIGTLAATSILACSAQAGPQGSYLTGYIGWFDISQQDNEATQFGLEYRMRPIEYGFRPMAGINVTNDGSVYAYGGFHWDVELIDNALYLSPNFAAGGYSQGDGKDLGSGIEFRSGLELAYQMNNAHRVGVAFNHISNASIGDRNPGAETLLITYSVPVGSLF